MVSSATIYLIVFRAPSKLEFCTFGSCLEGVRGKFFGLAKLIWAQEGRFANMRARGLASSLGRSTV